MSKPSFHILPSGINVSYEGKFKVISKSDRRYQPLLQAIREGQYERFGQILEDLEQYFFKHEGASFQDGKVSIDGKILPDDLNRYILGLAEEQIPFDRFIMFWRRLVKSDRYGPRQRLFAFLQHNGHPITEDGRFIAYRRVKETNNNRMEDGTLMFPDKPEGERVLVDIHTGTIDNSVGQSPSMDPADVDDDPNVTCSAGLHAANHEYANDFYSNGVLIEIAVAPEDVITVPIDYNGMKMRTCRYEVLAEVEGPREGFSVDIQPKLSETSERAFEHDYDDDDDYDDDYDNEDSYL